MKSFDGNKFLDSNACQVKLSNGKDFTVKELPDGIFKEINDMPDDASDKDLVKIFAKFIGATVDDIMPIGPVEIRGAISFLAENLLASK